GPDPRNFNQRVSLGRNDLLIRTFPKGCLFPISFFNSNFPFNNVTTLKDFNGLLLQAVIAKSSKNKCREL
nr:hypothetical protein [Serratia marcescens]